MSNQSQVRVKFRNFRALSPEARHEAEECGSEALCEAIFKREGVKSIAHLDMPTCELHEQVYEAYGQMYTNDRDLVRQVIDLDTHEVYYAHGRGLV